MSSEKWEKMCQPPEWAMKKIEAGRMKGKTDINPQWRYKIMSEVYGECGIGWKYSIDKLWTEQGSDGQVMCFALVSVATAVYSKENSNRINGFLPNSWSDAIPGIGGSMLVAKESSGLHTSDEGFKMAVTDALSVALKFLGVAANVYQGFKGDTKYDFPEKFDIKTLPEHIKEAFRALGYLKVPLVQDFCNGKTLEEIKKELESQGYDFLFKTKKEV